MECERAEKQLSALLDDELTPDEEREVREHLSDCPDCREQLGDFKTLDHLARTSYEEVYSPEDIREAVSERISEVETGGSETRTSSDEEAANRPGRRSRTGTRMLRKTGGTWKAVALAATVLIAVAAGFLFLRRKPTEEPREQGTEKPIAVLQQSDAGVVVQREDRRVEGKRGTRVYSRDQLRVPEGSRGVVRYLEENTRIELGGATTAEFWNVDRRKRIHLEQGTLRGDVEDQTGGRRLVINTSMARAEIVGTKFTLISSETSRLKVSEGSVAYTSLQRQKTVRVKAGEYAEVKPDGTLDHGSTRTTEQPKNNPPVARVGSDRTIRDLDTDGVETVTLDGSGSSDPDGSLSRFEWIEKGWEETIANGPGPTLELKRGTHQLALKVTDEQGASDTATVRITVERPEVLSEPREGTFLLRSRHSKKCMQVEEASTEDGANVEQHRCTGEEHQVFRLEQRSDGSYRVVAVHSDKVIGVKQGSMENGASIVQQSPGDGAHQQWLFEPLGNLDYMKVVSKKSGKVLDVSGHFKRDGTNIQQWKYWESKNQQWQLIPME